MRKTLGILGAFSLALTLVLPAFAQDSPSLGDLARQAQKDKEKDKANKAAAKVFTNDDMPSSTGFAGAAFGGAGSSAQGGRSGADLTPSQQLDQLDAVVSKVASLDKATLVRNVLQEKSDVQFPGRAAWEQRLMAARDAYVAQNRIMIQKARQIVGSAEGMKGTTPDPNDPRVKDLAAKLQTLSRDAVRTDAGLEAVVNEGRDLASSPATH
jgi:hypothetical protein